MACPGQHIPEHIDPPFRKESKVLFLRGFFNHKQIYGRKNKTNEPSKAIIAFVQRWAWA
jgi:hypothetical protein